MSDTPPLGPLDLHLKWKLSIESPSLAYINKCMSKTVLFAVDIPYPILKAWYSLVVEKSTQPTCINDQSATNEFNLWNYTDLLEYSIPGNAFAINQEQAIRSEINETIRSLACKVNAEYGITRGRKRQELDSRCKRVHIFQGQTVSLTDVRQQTQLANDQIHQRKNNCKDLETDILTLHKDGNCH